MTGLYDEIRKRLTAMTCDQLRKLARDEGICLGYAASRKKDMVDEIVAHLRYRDMMEAKDD